MSASYTNRLTRAFGKAAGIGLLGLSCATGCAHYAVAPLVPRPLAGIALPEDPYAKDDLALEQSINAALKKNHDMQPYSEALVASPDRLDMLIAQGMEGHDALKQLLAEKGFTNPAPQLVDSLLEALEHKVDSDSWLSSGGARITAEAQVFGVEQLCIVVPAHEDTVSQYLMRAFLHAGMGVDDAETFINAHESEHCLDTLSDKGELTEMELELERNGLSGGEKAKLASKPDSVNRLVQSYIAEALADETAIGSMVRGKNYPASLIGKLAAMRASIAVDAVHDTASVLYVLENKVNKMGVGKFRGLTDAEAQSLYTGVIRQNGLSTPAAMQAYIGYAFGDRREMTSLEKKAAHDPATAWGVYAGKTTDAWGKNSMAQLKPGEESSVKSVLAWDETSALRRKAMTFGGVNSNAAMLRAYLALQQEFRAASKAHPFDITIPAKAGKLRSLKLHSLMPHREVFGAGEDTRISIRGAAPAR